MHLHIFLKILHGQLEKLLFSSLLTHIVCCKGKQKQTALCHILPE